MQQDQMHIRAVTVNRKERDGILIYRELGNPGYESRFYTNRTRLAIAEISFTGFLCQNYNYSKAVLNMKIPLETQKSPVISI